MENNKDKKVSKTHVYDGIVEQNNSMPTWWVALFMACCMFSAIYFIHYASGDGPTLKQEYNEDFKNFKEKMATNSPPEAVETEESLRAYMASEVAIMDGKNLYLAKCAMCHGANLEGKIGPNLTDSFWTTGDGSRLAVIQTINKGSAAKGMPSWEAVLSHSEIKNVTAFIYSKIGSHPENAKAAEGVEVKK